MTAVFSVYQCQNLNSIMATNASQVRLSASRVVSGFCEVIFTKSFTKSSNQSVNLPAIIACVCGAVCMAATLLRSDAVMYASGFMTLSAVAVWLRTLPSGEEGGEL